MKRNVLPVLCALAFLALPACRAGAGAGAGAASGKKVDVPRLLAGFSTAWPSARKDYRTPGDNSWKAYATTLRDLVAGGPAAVPGLRKGLAHKNRQVRSICARALGFLGAKAAVPELIGLLKTDPWTTVRMMAADSLGMIPAPAGLTALRAAQKVEKKGDVLLHIKVALGRKSGVEPGAVKDLLKIDEKTMSGAVVGKPAPDFTLEDPDGKQVTLSSYRGKKWVVLVFIYGDG